MTTPNNPRHMQPPPPSGPVPGQPAPAGVVALWSDTVGRAATRCGQVLLIAAVSAGVVWLLLRVYLVMIAAFVALVFASAVYPLVRWLVGKGWSRLSATGVVFVGIFTLLSGVVTEIVFAVRTEWDSLSTSAVEGWHRLQQFIMSGPLPVDTGAVDNALQRATGLIASGTFLGSAVTGITIATEAVTGLILMIVILFFFLKDGPKIWNFTLRWFHGDTRAKLAESGDRTIQILGGYVRGTVIINVIEAVVIGVPLALLGVPLALPLAVIVFVLGFLPIIGATFATTLAALVALVTNGLVTALIIVALAIAINQLESHLLQPVIMGRTLSLHAIVVLLALAVGTLVGGFFGAVLAVPLAAVAWAVIQVWTDTYQAGEDPVLGEDPVNPESRVGSKSTMAQRWKYQQMRYQELFDLSPVQGKRRQSRGKNPSDNLTDPSRPTRPGGRR
ncbi:AI-2E family transporter [Corynebacterium comes]|uniref:AI-2 transport protein TqsA n=1 Tax=Corynebacterium comes TaxID=2675218 RepID=A0A6B8WC73_9CORY|nr:AI-2E family transporter [Corynebacterium comes]QGU04418.1 AI-2 transport protein TqsA [Corynebacterium comes]